MDSYLGEREQIYLKNDGSTKTFFYICVVSLLHCFLFYLFFLRLLDIADFRFESNEQAKAEKLKAAKKMMPYYLERLDTHVKKNGDYFVGGALTWADFTFVSLLDYLTVIEENMMEEDIIEKYKNLK